MSVYHPPHRGELLVQSERGFGQIDPYRYAKPGIPPDMVFFLTGLPFLPVATLDHRNRPWTSLLSSSEGCAGFAHGGKSAETDNIHLEVDIPEGTPIKALLDRLDKHPSRLQAKTELFAMLGVDLSNRRRNKFDGWLFGTSQDKLTKKWTLSVQVRSTLGNCPKYINIHRLRYLESESSVVSPLASEDWPAGLPLPEYALDIIRAADIAFLATRHTGSGNDDISKVAVNIRGGRRGYIRTYWDENRVDDSGMLSAKGRTCVVLPDWSGNRFMQSLGNLAVEGDRVAGLTIPVWGVVGPSGYGVPSSVLHLTGETELLSGDSATAVMRGVRGLVKIWVTGWTLVQGGVPLAITVDRLFPSPKSQMTCLSADIMALVDAMTEWSPYNPSLRMLNKETNSGEMRSSSDVPTAQLVDASLLTETMGIFVWKVSFAPQKWKLSKAGQHVVLDMSKMIVQRYQHMSGIVGREKDLNDDGVRSYTITSISRSSNTDGTWMFTLALRLVEGGAVTPKLFQYAQQLREWRSTEHNKTIYKPPSMLSVPFLGVEGDFTLPIPPAAYASLDDTLRVAYFASGIGITPLLAHLSALRESVSCREPGGGGVVRLQVFAVIAARTGDVLAMDEMVHTTLMGPSGAEDVLGEEDGVVALDVQVHFVTKATADQQLYSTFIRNDTRFRELASSIKVLRKWHTNTHLSEESVLPSHNPASHKPSGLEPPQGFTLPTNPFNIKDAEAVYLCGSSAFEAMVRLALRHTGLDPEKIKSESFSF